MVKRNYKYISYIFLFIGIICIGWSAIFVKFADIPGPVSALYRFLIAGAVILPWQLFRRKKLPIKRDIILISIGGVFFALDIAIWNMSLLLSPAATATLLNNSSPLWIGLASYIIFRDKLHRLYWLGLLIALSGMAFLVGREALNQLELTRGNLLAIASSGFYAAYIMITHRARARVDVPTFMAISISMGIIVLLVMNLGIGTTFTGYSLKTWASLAGLGLITHVGGWLSINYALGHLHAAPVSVGLLGQVIITALLSIPLLGELLNANQIIGGVLVLCGILLVNFRRRTVTNVSNR